MSTKERDIVYTRVLEEGKPVNMFLGLIKVDIGTTWDCSKLADVL